MTSHVSERGQITIDREARKRLGVQPGMIAYQRVVDGRLEIVFLPAPHRRSLSGALATAGNQAADLSSDELEEAVMEAVAEVQARRERDRD